MSTRNVFRLTIPEPKKRSHPIWPVFIPFAGCPYRCIYCSQNAQTGKGTEPLQTILQTLENNLNEAQELGRGPYELAFFGGNFTALPEDDSRLFLDLARRYTKTGFVSGVRCSTRPDAVSKDSLLHFKEQGLDLVELGIQSFDDHALKTSGRRYSGTLAREAAHTVHEAGLGLGIQLMPGLPGDRLGVFRSDVETAIDLKPDCVRLYPCIVMEGTALAERWRNGEYRPWELEQAREELALALNAFRKAGIRVIRIGLAPEESMNASILAGPWHPALGQSVRALALYHALGPHLKGVRSIAAPRRYQGEFFGHKGELKARYADLGLDERHVRFEDRSDFRLEG